MPAALFAIGVVFRLRHLNDPVRYDEAFTFLDYVHAPLWDTLGDYSTANNHFLNTLLVRLTASVLGDQPWLWRLPDFMAGVGTMILVWVIAKRWFGRGAGVVALFVMCISPVMAHFSVLARGYILQLFFGLTALLLIDIRHDRKSRRLVSLGAGVSCALACYAVPTGLFLISAVFAYDAYLTYRRRAPFTTLLALWLPAALLTFVLYLPPLLNSGPGAFFQNVGDSSVTALSFSGLQPYAAALLDEITWGVGGGWFWVPVAAVGLVVGSVKRPAFALLGGVCLLGCIVLLGAGFRPPARVFIYLLPIVSLGIGAAAEGACRKSGGRGPALKAAGVALVAAAVAAVAVAERSRYLSNSSRAGPVPAARAALEYLAENYPDGFTLVASAPLNYPLIYYARHSECDSILILGGRSPQAYTFEAFVAVPAGAPLHEVVRDGTGGRGVVLRADFVTDISDVGIWRALIICPSPPSD